MRIFPSRKRKIITAAISAALIALFAGCHFMETMTNTPVDTSAGILSFDQSQMSLDIGEVAVLNLKAEKNQNTAPIAWKCEGAEFIKYDKNNYGAVLTAVSTGHAVLTASCGGYSTKCVVTITSRNYTPKVEYPYVYASTDVVNIMCGEVATIYASAYGGTRDISGWEWTKSNPSDSTITIASEGNYCRIKGNSPGQAMITVKNPSVSTLGYSVIVNVSREGLVYPYITTSSNVINLNLSDGKEESFEVEVKNPKNGQADQSKFTYKIVGEDDKLITAANSPVEVTTTGKSFLVKPVKTGVCIIRVSHEEAPYSLDVIARVGKDPSLIYVELDKKTMTLTSEGGVQTVKASLMFPYSGSAQNTEDTSLFEWSASDDAERYVSWQINGGNNSNTGNVLVLTPKANGIAKFTVRYPSLADNSASVAVIVKNIESDARNALTYISTSQNYIKAFAGGDDITVNVDIYNAVAGEENRMHWEIVNEAKDGSNKKVVEWKSGTGTHSSRAAVAVNSNTTGHAVIHPANPGKATITLSHPSAMYPTSIVVNVADKNEPRESAPWYLSCDKSMIYVTADNNSGTDFGVLLTGEGVKGSDIDNIRYECEENDIFITGTGGQYNARYTGTKSGRTRIKFFHDNSPQAIYVPVVYGATSQSAAEMRVISSGSPQNQIIHTGETTTINIDTMNIPATENISWDISDENVLEIISAERGGKVLTLSAKQQGFCRVTASAGDAGSIDFNITVKPAGRENDYEEVYLTSKETSVYMKNRGEMKKIEVTAVNLNAAGLLDLEWKIWETDGNGRPKTNADGERIPSSEFSVSPNRNTAVITAEADIAEAVLSVSHELSENELFVTLRCGNQFAFRNEDFAYIQADKDIIELVLGQKETVVTAVLAHTEKSELEETGFEYTISNPSIAKISYARNMCFIEPENQGAAVLTISHKAASGGIALEIPVIVKSPENMKNLPYITTQMNVINIIEGRTEAVSVSLMNASSENKSDWTWTVSDSSVCEIAVPSGNTVMLRGKKAGATEITVKNRQAKDALHLIAVVAGNDAASVNPYISTSTSIITLSPGQTETFSTQMIGGTPAESAGFFYNSSNPQVAVSNGNGGSCRVTAISEGTSEITITNTYHVGAITKKVLVVVRNTVVPGCEIELDSQIIVMEPDRNQTRTLKASLAGGTAEDAMNFSWWVEDPTFAEIKCIAGECEIRSTGKTGVTTLKIAHPKVLNPRSVTLSFTKYTQFAFSENNINLTAGDIAYIPLEVPSEYIGRQITLSSNDETVAMVAGIGTCCMIQALDETSGTAIIYAGLMIDGQRVASAECRVTVTPKDFGSATITTQSDMLIMEAGETGFLTAQVSGAGLPGNAADRLVWEITTKISRDGEISADGYADGLGMDMAQNAGEKVTGDTAFITACEPGEYIIKVSYTSFEGKEIGRKFILIKVPDRRDMAIIISSASIEVLSGKAFELEAELYNAPSGAEQKIHWEVLDNGAAACITTSAYGSGTTGKKCAFNASTSQRGTCLVRATYTAKNGQEVSSVCFVTVKNRTKLVVSTRDITVYPDGTERIYYYLDPPGTAIEHVATQNMNTMGETETFFAYNLNTNEQYIEVVGIKSNGKAPAGTITLLANGLQSADKIDINVYVNYDCEFTLTCEQMSGLTYHFKNPTGTDADCLTLRYTCFPAVLDVDWEEDLKNAGLDDYIEVHEKFSCEQVDPDSGRTQRDGYVKLKPLKEFSERQVSFQAKNANFPLLNEGTVRERAFICYYDAYSFTVEWTLEEGAFSRYDADKNIFRLGDGEGATCLVKVDQPLASFSEMRVSYTPDPMQNKDGVSFKNYTETLKYRQKNTDNPEFQHAYPKNKTFKSPEQNYKGMISLTGPGTESTVTGDTAQIKVNMNDSNKNQFSFRLAHEKDVYSNMRDGDNNVYTFQGGRNANKNTAYYDYLIKKDMVVTQSGYEEYYVRHTTTTWSNSSHNHTNTQRTDYIGSIIYKQSETTTSYESCGCQKTVTVRDSTEKKPFAARTYRPGQGSGWTGWVEKKIRRKPLHWQPCFALWAVNDWGSWGNDHNYYQGIGTDAVGDALPFPFLAKGTYGKAQNVTDSSSFGNVTISTSINYDGNIEPYYVSCLDFEKNASYYIRAYTAGEEAWFPVGGVIWWGFEWRAFNYNSWPAEVIHKGAEPCTAVDQTVYEAYRGNLTFEYKSELDERWYTVNQMKDGKAVLDSNGDPIRICMPVDIEVRYCKSYLRDQLVFVQNRTLAMREMNGGRDDERSGGKTGGRYYTKRSVEKILGQGSVVALDDGSYELSARYREKLPEILLGACYRQHAVKKTFMYSKTIGTKRLPPTEDQLSEYNRKLGEHRDAKAERERLKDEYEHDKDEYEHDMENYLALPEEDRASLEPPSAPVEPDYPSVPDEPEYPLGPCVWDFPDFFDLKYKMEFEENKFKKINVGTENEQIDPKELTEEESAYFNKYEGKIPPATDEMDEAVYVKNFDCEDGCEDSVAPDEENASTSAWGDLWTTTPCSS